MFLGIDTGGTFTDAGGTAANTIARWDGATWEPLGAGMTGYTLRHGASGVGSSSSGADIAVGDV